MINYLGQGVESLLCEDESRFGLKTLLSRVITLLGIKPIAQVQWSRENFWLYGAVEPATGAHFMRSLTLILPSTVLQLSAAFPDSLNLLQLDRQLSYCYDLSVAR